MLCDRTVTPRRARHRRAAVARWAPSVLGGGTTVSAGRVHRRAMDAAGRSACSGGAVGSCGGLVSQDQSVCRRPQHNAMVAGASGARMVPAFQPTVGERLRELTHASGV